VYWQIPHYRLVLALHRWLPVHLDTPQPHTDDWCRCVSGFENIKCPRITCTANRFRKDWFKNDPLPRREGRRILEQWARHSAVCHDAVDDALLGYCGSSDNLMNLHSPIDLRMPVLGRRLTSPMLSVPMSEPETTSAITRNNNPVWHQRRQYPSSTCMSVSPSRRRPYAQT